MALSVVPIDDETTARCDAVTTSASEAFLSDASPLRGWLCCVALSHRQPLAFAAFDGATTSVHIRPALSPSLSSPLLSFARDSYQ